MKFPLQSPWVLLAASALAALSFAVTSRGATYYIDFAAGADANPGTAATAALKHAPGDPAATGLAAGLKLQPGDTVRFKGGVAYRGIVNVTASGTGAKPITFDGNTEGSFGAGKAIVDGAEPVTGWKHCASATEAKGNPRWAEIFYTDVPKPKAWNTLNLCDADTALPIAQQPNPRDPLFQEDPNDYTLCESPLVSSSAVNVTPGPGLRVNKQRPLLLLLDQKAKTTAIVDPLVGGSFNLELSQPVIVTSLGIAPQPNYPAAREVVFSGDGKELLRATLERDKKEIQKFKLPQPATFSKLTVKLLAAFEGETKTYTAIRQVAAYTADGVDVFSGSGGGGMTLTDPKGLNEPAADHYAGMMFAFHGGANFVHYLPVESYDPAAHRLTLPIFSGNLYKETQYSFFNSVRLIDLAGEYSVETLPDPNMARVFLLPANLADGLPADIGAASRTAGISLQSASHVVVQGFILRRQNDCALEAKGPASNVVLRDCEVTLVRAAAALSGHGMDRLTVERCYVHHNPGHTRGIVLHTCTNGLVRDCRVVKNTATGIDYYTCSDSQMIGNTVTGQRGMHANGLTCYVQCKNILVEGNHVADGWTALTFQEIDHILIRNNVFDGNDRSTVVGIWPTAPTKNVQFLNNTIIRSKHDTDFTVGLFTNSRDIEGLVVRNNIIDGLFNTVDGVLKRGVYSNNLYTRKGLPQATAMLGQSELYEPDLKKIFVDPEKDDFRLRPGSPALGAGMDVGLETDITNEKVPKGKAPDIGAYQWTAK